jgi:hypothetical protein
MADASGHVNGEPVDFDELLRPFVLHANVDGHRLDRMIEGACQRAVGRIEGGTDVATVIRGMVASAMALGYFLGTEPDE